MTTDRTHWEDCWKQPDHHACALARIAELEALACIAELEARVEELKQKRETLSVNQAAIIGAYTGFLCGNFYDLHTYAERLMGRSISIHEIRDEVFAEKLSCAAKDDFLKVCGHPVEVKEEE